VSFKHFFNKTTTKESNQAANLQEKMWFLLSNLPINLPTNNQPLHAATQLIISSANLHPQNHPFVTKSKHLFHKKFTVFIRKPAKHIGKSGSHIFPSIWISGFMKIHIDNPHETPKREYKLQSNVSLMIESR
jgi:hypothetical protein